MIRLIIDRSTYTEEKNILGFKRNNTWKINKETIEVDKPHELEIAALGCINEEMIRFNGMLYEPLHSDNMKQLRAGASVRIFDSKPYLLVQNTENQNVAIQEKEKRE
jgi:hypothetical protein